jgi:hypothetical protein
MGTVAAPADARIVLDKNIEGVAPGMSAAQVRHKLGKPLEVYRSRGTVPFDSWSYGRAGRYPVRMWVLFLRHGKKLAPANAVGTGNPKERTSNGIHPGMTLAKLRARVHGLVCKFGLCFTHDPMTYDGIVTRFRLSNQRKPTLISSIELVRSTPPPKPKKPSGPSAPRPAAEGGPNVARDFTASCPCWPRYEIGFDVVPPAHEDHSYALVQTYQWDFGDGKTAGGWYESAASHAYDTPGTYTVTLTMTDEEGQRWFITKPVEVKAPRPAAESPNPLMFKDIDVGCPDGSCTPGSTISFNVVYAREDGVHTYPSIVSWDFGDGTSGDNNDSTYHAYAAPGTYTVTVTMADGNDEWYLTKQVQITG